MDHAHQIESVRVQVFDAARQIGVPEDEVAHPLETILLDDGYFVGRKFRWETLWAVWFQDEGNVEFYGEDAALLKVLHLEGDFSRQDAA
jgi:hypothetical protein